MVKIDPLSCGDCPVMQLWRILPARNHPNDDNDDDDFDDFEDFDDFVIGHYNTYDHSEYFF